MQNSVPQVRNRLTPESFQGPRTLDPSERRIVAYFPE